MMAYSEDHIALAAEYALGTLEADERAQVESMMAVDANFATMVGAWEQKLGILNQMVGSVEPRAEVWDRIRSAVGLSQSHAPLALPQDPTPAPAVAAVERPASAADTVTAGLVAADAVTADKAAADTMAVERAAVGNSTALGDSNVIRLSAQARRWRTIATGMTAIAAALVAVIVVGLYQPDLLPGRLRPKTPSQTQVAENKTSSASAKPAAQYVALLQKDGGSPAFILTVDGATRNFTVRKVDAAAPEPGKSYELWLISDKLPQPRSLGVIGSGDFTVRPILTSYDANTIDTATYAVTQEQAGGSPDGKPTSAPIYSGKLIEAVPPAGAQ